ncbi:MAG: GNAT family N-acetyltransferase [Thermodesulfobacteriota bacterium]
MKVVLDTWLTQVFGYQVFKLSLPADAPLQPLSHLSIQDLVRGSPEEKAFYFVKTPVHRVDEVRALSAAGFIVVEASIVLQRLPEILPPEQEAGVVEVRDVEPQDHDALLRIAESSFVYSRFHLDSRIDASTANRVKREWVNSYLTSKRGERLLVAGMDGRAVGFLAVLAFVEDGLPVGVIDLIAVSKSHQGHGVGRALVRSFINDSFGRFERLIVGTQAANEPSIRLYEGCGFRYSHAVYVLHAHVVRGEIVR